MLRIDDLDTPRVKSGKEAQTIEDLRWLGLDWDEDEPVLRQSERRAVYDAALDDLAARGLVYPCVCTRKEVAEAASAPHGPEGPRYPGTCRGRFPSLAAASEVSEVSAAAERPAALRFVTREGCVAFDDGLFGPQTFDPAAETGDFPVRRGNGTAAYQLATVVDDAASGVDLVIRGADLLPSTARQILLQQALGLPPVAYLHLPLVVGADGRRLAKRHGDTSLRGLRDRGYDATAIVGWLAHSAGLAPEGARLRAADLVGRYDPATLARTPVIVGVDAFGGSGGTG